MNNESEEKNYTYNELAEICLTKYEEKYGTRESKNYKIDDVNKATVKAVCQYFANDPEFEKIKEGYSLKKGLMIIGRVGTGKTHLMRNFQNNPRGRYKIVRCSDVSNDFSISGTEALLKYARCYNPDNNSLIGKCFDDLGLENIGNHFSHTCNTMKDTIEALYANTMGQYHLIHITSNLLPKEIEDRYGLRVASRLKEMVNVITLLGDDRRK